MTTLKQINKVLRKSANRNSNDFVFAFLDREDEILNLLKNFEGTKSEIYLKEVNQELHNLLRFSCLFSDLTLLNVTPSTVNESHIMVHEAGSDYFRETQLTIPPEYLRETGTDPSRFFQCHIHRTDSETKKIFQQFSPLIKSGRLIVRPLRALNVIFHELKQFTLYYVDPNTSNDHWFINKIKQGEAITIDNGYLRYTDVVDLFTISLPYFENVNLNTLNKILEEENEDLSRIRYNIFKVVQEAGNDPTRIEEIKQDIAYSSIEKLTAKFKLIQGKHRLTLGDSILGTFGLTLAFGHVDMESLIKALAISNIANFMSDYDYRSKITDLKDDSFYLLWRVNKSK